MRKSPAYGSHHEHAELAALLHQLAESEAVPSEGQRRDLTRFAVRIEASLVERLAVPLAAGVRWLRRPRD